jgi:hypothetical protein
LVKTPEQKITWAKRMREYRKKNPDSFRNSDLKKSFGITLDIYNEMLSEQAGVCAICGNPETIVDNRTNKIRNLAVDHCHTTKKVRGLLCMGCNQGLGNFRENPDFLAKAISYILERK